METENLSDILNGTTPEAPAAEQPPAEAPAAEAAPERPRDPATGQFVAKGDDEPEPQAEPAPEGAPPAPSEDDSPTVPRAAHIDERRKRQAAETEAGTLKAKLAEMSQRLAQIQPQAPASKPDQWEDPEGHEQWLVEQAGQVAEQRALQAYQRQHVIMSAEAAKAKYPDYLEKVAIFEQLSAENPALSAQMFNHPNPAEFAYGVAKNHEEVSQYGSLDAWKAAEKAKWEAEALEKLKATLPASSAPPTLSNERNLGQRSGPEWSGPTPLSDLLQ
jgi:hypothetical protein